MDPSPPPLVAFTEQAPFPLGSFALPHVVTRVFRETRGPRRQPTAAAAGGGTPPLRACATRSGGCHVTRWICEKARRRRSPGAMALGEYGARPPTVTCIFGLKRERRKP